MDLDETLLMTPGPTFTSHRILQAASKPLVHHREKEFVKIINESYEMLRKLFKTENDVFIITGSGTAAMDAAVSNIVEQGDKVLCIVSGKFSDRLRDMVKNYGGTPVVLGVKPGKTVDPKLVKEKLEEVKGIKAVTMVHNNTSTGSVNPVKDIGEVTKEHDVLLLVDTISSLGGDHVDVDDFHIDLCFSGSQKCLALPPGLSFISVSQKAWEKIERKESKPFYLDLLKYKKSYPQTPFTIAINMVFALNESLKMLFEEGLEKRIKRHEICAEMTREAVKALNLEPFVEDEVASKTVTSVKIPRDINIPREIQRMYSDSKKKMRDKALRETLKKYGVLVAKGQSWKISSDEKVDLLGEIFRIGHMGLVTPKHIITTITALELTLKELGLDVEIGSGIKKAEEVYERRLNELRK